MCVSILYKLIYIFNLGTRKIQAPFRTDPPPKRSGTKQFKNLARKLKINRSPALPSLTITPLRFFLQTSLVTSLRSSRIHLPPTLITKPFTIPKQTPNLRRIQVP